MISVVSLVGRLGGDPQQKRSQKGSDYLTFNLAVERGFGDNKATDWYSCIAFDRSYERVLKLKAAKGSLVHVIGALEIEQFKRKDGSQGMEPKVTLYDFEYVTGSGKKDAQQTQGAAQSGTPATTQSPAVVQAQAPTAYANGDLEEFPLNGEDFPF